MSRESLDKMDDDFSFLYSTTGQDEDEEAKAGGGWLVMISEADFVHQDPKTGTGNQDKSTICFWDS